MNKPAVQLLQITKRIGAKTIIDGLTLDIYPGEVFGLLGPNGAGKTTTIRMLVGLISCTSGDITIHGHSIIRDFKKAIAHIGAVVENPEFYEFMTGYQNLRHYANMYPGVSRERIEEVVSLVGLAKRIADPVKTYSLGMRQRLGIAQALLHQPSVLILDEPTNGLDPAGIKELREYLRQLTSKQKVAVIVSSHLLSEMELMCDRTAIIQKGTLLDILVIGENIRNGAGSPVFLIEVDHIENAREIMANSFNKIFFTTSGNTLEVNVPRENLPDITACFIHAGLKVYTIQPKVKSLEESFMEVTSNEPID